jgi:hypothetical protein
MTEISSENADDKKRASVPTVSRILSDGSILELLYRPDDQRTALALYNAGRWTAQHHVDSDERHRLVPFSPQNNLIRNEVVLLPSEPRIYGNERACWPIFKISFIGTSI